MFDQPAKKPPRHIIGNDTRNKLLASAADVFLEFGFRAARVQDIAKRAGVRLSAINYHFDSKEGLYLAVLRQHAERAIAFAPLSAAQPPDSLSERFNYSVRSLVERMLNDGSETRISQFMLREFVNPTAALDVMIERFSKPQAEEFLKLLNEILGPSVPPDAVERSLISIFSQCIIYAAGLPVIKRIVPQALVGDDLHGRIARHIADFSWAGLMAIKQQWPGQTNASL
jgi:TetR/AcrR family transcriptional regulator, regulator of cefoperazone and chloramphenicol sensitivity